MDCSHPWVVFNVVSDANVISHFCQLELEQLVLFKQMLLDVHVSAWWACRRRVCMEACLDQKQNVRIYVAAAFAAGKQCFGMRLGGGGAAGAAGGAAFAAAAASADAAAGFAAAAFAAQDTMCM